MELQLQKLTQKFEQPPFVSFRVAIEMKSIEQEQLDREKEEYFSRGGEVKTYSPTSVLMEPDAKPQYSQVPNQRKKTWSTGAADNSSLVAYHSRNKLVKRLNITEKKLVSKTVYTLNIAGKFYGKFETEDAAVLFRNDKRKELGMESAEY